MKSNFEKMSSLLIFIYQIQTHSAKAGNMNLKPMLPEIRGFRDAVFLFFEGVISRSKRVGAEEKQKYDTL
jgi:hypothetical protein